MAILQISKIQHRSGKLVDLPQLDDAEFGWASDERRLFIGKTTPNENVEVLTAYSRITFNQIDGAVGNLNINPVNIGNGQLLVFDGTNWVNKGGLAGGLITLGDAANVKLTGGAIGYVLQTDGTGNLSWAPKGTLVSGIVNVSKSNPAIVTTVSDNFFTDGAQITIVNPQGMTQLAGNIYYANALTTTTFSLYSDSDLTVPVDTSGSGYNTYAYTAVTGTTDYIQVGNAALFSVGQPVRFLGDLSTSGIENNVTYYVSNIAGNTVAMKVATSTDLANTVLPLQPTTGLTANVYAIDGQAVSTIGGGASFSIAEGTDTTVQYNAGGGLQGSSAFTFDYGANILTLNGNANVGNLNATTSVTTGVLISTVATGTAPFVVNSTTQVANLSVATAGTATTAGTVTTNAQPNITSVGTLANLSVSGTTGLTSTDSTGAASITKIINAVNGTRDLALIPRAGAGSYNTLTAADDALITFANSSAQGNANLTIAPWSSANTGIRIQSVSNTATIFLNATNTNVSAALNVVGNVSAGNLSGTLVGGTLTTAAQPNITSTGSLTAPSFTATSPFGTVLLSTDAGGSISLGKLDGSSSSPYLDFNTSATPVDFNVRLMASGNTGTIGSGTLTTYAAVANFTGALQTTALTTGANTTAGTVTGNWTLTDGSRIQATYADLAEYYEADDIYEPGTVLMFGGDKEVTIAEDGTNRVAGVVSTNPAYVMNASCPGLLTAVALQGRVPCKVRGKISKGDMLISGGNGYARPNQFPTIGTVIGKALENFDGYEGVIEVAVGRL